ncbi:MAG: hypothetical protein QNL33_17580 [Akkermansiaceae bacterium]|jgi:hypothetical protein
MNLKRIAILALLPVLSHSPASAQSIGLNLGSGRLDAALDPAESAGVVVQSNWNNLAGGAGGPQALLDSLGSGTTAEVSWATDEQWSIGTVPGGPDGKLLNGFVSDNNSNGDNSTVTITGIPFGIYDLYIYVNHDRAMEDVILSEANGAFADFTAIENDTDIAATVAFVPQTTSATDSGNYVKFPALTVADLGIVMKAVDLGGAGGPGSLERNAIAGIQIVNVTPGDADGDGLEDAWETAFGLDPDDNGLNPNNNNEVGNPDNGAAGDPDSDGSPNSRELLQGSSPIDDDSDDDTLLDGVETGTGNWNGVNDRGTSPTMADTDGDTLSDRVEDNSGSVNDPLTGTNPNQADTDDDGLRDDWELNNLLSPFDNGGLDVNNGPAGDPDSDNSENLDEQARGTDPQDNDSDNDTLLDGVETDDGNFVDLNATGTDPLDDDTDGDTLLDGEESNTLGTNPNLRDTDGDFLRDDWEISNLSDPLTDGDNALNNGGIGLNLGAGRADATLFAGDVAGAFPQDNWNNLAGPAIFELALIDEVGVTTGAMVSVAMDEEWSVVGPAADANGILLTGWFATQNVDGNNTIDISDIPYANYDLVLYFNHDRGAETADISEANNAFPAFTVREINTDILNPVTFMQQVASNGEGFDDRGNFMIIPGLSAATLNLVVNAGTIGVDRGPLSGLQLVNRGSADLEITKIVSDPEANTVELTWTAVNGRKYIIESSTDLTEATWLEAEDEITATDSTMSFILRGVNFAGNSRIFYRVRPSQ